MPRQTKGELSMLENHRGIRYLPTGHEMNKFKIILGWIFAIFILAFLFLFIFGDFFTFVIPELGDPNDFIP